MARQKMVTRTFNTTNASVLCVDVDSAETTVITVTLPRVYKDDKEELKVVKNMIDTDTFKAVKVVEKEIVETLYGMPEEDFIKLATILPPRSAENSEAEDETEN